MGDVIARLKAQLSQTREQLARTREQLTASEERSLQIEQAVREELADEMDRRLAAVRREALEARRREDAWRDEFVDDKIEILRRGFERGFLIHEDSCCRCRGGGSGDSGDSDGGRVRGLEDENEALRREIASLRRREAVNLSPTKHAGGSSRLKMDPAGRVFGGIENAV